MKKLFEKTILEKWILSFLLIGIFSFLFTSDLQATHFRYGSVTWEPVQGQANTIKFTVRAAWRRDFGGFPSNVSVGQTVNTSNGSNANFRFGGNTNLGLDEPMIAIVTAVNVAENWIQTEWIKTVTYSSGPGDYTAYFQSCCRINELQNNTTNNPPNNGGSNQLNYRVETIVNVGSGNRPPTTTLPTIINLQTNQNTADIQVPGVDPDGDNIAFRLATASEATYGGGLGFGGSGNPNNNPYGPPAGLSISSTGLISFNTVGKAIGELYSISVVLEDDEVGALGISKTMVDVLVRIVGESLPPEFDYTVTPANGSLIKVAPGDNVNFTVKATDPDPTNLFGESDVSIQAAGAPGAGSFTPPLPTTPADPTTTTFDWTPVSGTADLGTYVLSFFAEDGLGVQTVTNVTIVVTLAPVFTQASGQALPECLTEGDVLSRTIEASDLDPSDQVSIISIGVQNPPSTFAAGFPVQTTVSPNILTSIPTTVGNPTTTQLDWTVAASDWGIYELVFTAEDSYLDQTELEHYYIVDAAPQFTSSPVVNAFENQVYSYTVTATDPDVVASLGDAIFIDPTKSTIPSWLTLVDNGDGTAVLSGTPTNAEVGPHVVSIELHDKTTHYRHTHCTQDFQNFTITVNPCNITLTASIVDEDCPGANDGSIDLSVAGATGATTYAWSNGDNMEDISGLAPNNYTVMVTDNVGCVQSASFTINAGIDSSPPSISCPSDMAVYNTPGSCDAIVNFTVSGTDNCGTPTIVSTPASGSVFSLGTTTVTSTSTDGSGNVASCSFTVTVVDDEDPTISCSPEIIVSNDPGQCGAKVTYNITSSDNCGMGPIAGFQYLGAFGNNSYYISQGVFTWTQAKADAEANGGHLATITDANENNFIAPFLAGRQPWIGLVDLLQEGVYQWITGEPFGYSNWGPGEPNNQGNEDYGHFRSDGQWNDLPNAGPGFNPTQYVLEIEGVTVNQTNGIASGETFPIGTTLVSYEATDAAGNTASCSFNVTVNDTEAPSINCPADGTRLTDSGACDYTAGGGEFDPTATDNCNQNTNINDYNDGSTLDGASFDVGTTTVTWTTTDANGNMDVCSFDITVNKAADPTLLFAYTMIARKEVHVHESDVQSGGVGVWESGKKAKVHHESNVTSFVKAPIIDQDNNSTIGTSIIGEALVPLPVFRINTMSSNLDLKVEDNQMHTINPGDPIAYDKIEVKKNATLIVNVPELYGKEIKTKDGATISFGQTTEVMLEKKFDLDKNNTFNSTGEAVYVYTEKQMDVKEGGNVIANVYALNHIHVKGKSNSLTHMTGLYISDDKIKADKHSVWNWVASACTWPAPPAAPYIANTENSGIQTLKEITNEISKEGFKVFPNPANNEVNIRLHGEDVAGTHILIYDQLGKVVWERILTEYETSLKVNFSDTKFQTGIYTVAVISSDEVMAKRLVISK